MSVVEDSLPLGSQIFSVDDHLLELDAHFETRVEQKYAEDAPRVVDLDGGDAWLIEGTPVAIGYNDGVGSWSIGTRPLLAARMKHAQSGEAFQGPQYKLVDDSLGVPRSAQERLAKGVVRVREDFRAGVYDVDARVADMVTDGVCAQVLIPSMSFGFAGQRLSLVKDPGASLAFVRAYNDWLAEDVAGKYPERFVCSQVVWLQDPVVAADEIRKNAERGFTAALFPENPERFGFPSIHNRVWDPFFAACEETETVLNLHIGTGLQSTRPSSDSPLPVGKATVAANPIISAFDWVFSGIAVRYPRIKMAWTEGGIDFVPLAYGRLSTMWIDSLEGFWDAEISPAELLLRNFWFAALWDVGAYQFMAKYAPDHCMIETDFPHGDTLWPDSQEHFAGRLEGLTPDVKRRFLVDNAAALYRHPVTA